MSESEELPSWTTQCGAQTLSVFQIILPSGETAWEVGESMRLRWQVDTFAEAKRAYNMIKSVIEGNHQNVLRCCVNPNYALGPTRESAEPEEKLAYATPCGRRSISVVRKTTITGRDVWDVTNGHDDHVVAEMFDTFESAKSSYEFLVDAIKMLHADCCIIT